MDVSNRDGGDVGTRGHWFGEHPLTLAALAAILVLYAAVSVTGIHRDGYSIDEEFAYFAIQGIRDTGFPRLPSGALENRGLPYTYSAWLAGVVLGDGFPSYRYPNLLAGVASLIVIFTLARRWLSAPTAVLVAAGTALLPWQILGAEWARLYGMFVASYLASLLLFVRMDELANGERLWVASVAFSHLLHEFALTLLLLPAIAYVVDPGGAHTGRRVTRVTVLAAAAFLVSEAMLYLLHMWASAPAFRTLYGYAVMHALPVAWETTGTTPDPRHTYPLMRRLFAPETWRMLPTALIAVGIALVLASRLRLSRVALGAVAMLAASEQYGRAWLIAAAWAFSRRSAAIRILLCSALAVVGMAVATSVAIAIRAGGTLSLSYLRSITVYALQQVSGAWWALLEVYPFSIACLFCVALATSVRRDTPSSSMVRLVILLLVGWLFVFDVLAVDFQPRYYVAFWPLVVLAVGYLGEMTIATSVRSRRHIVAQCLIVGTVLGFMLKEHYAVPDDHRVDNCWAGEVPCAPQMRSYDLNPEPIVTVRKNIAPSDVVVCTDELACLLLIGRSDYWLYRGTLYAYPSLEGAIGVYGGSPIVSSVDALRRLIEEDVSERNYWIVMPSVVKYPPWDRDALMAALPPRSRSRVDVVQARE